MATDASWTLNPAALVAVSAALAIYVRRWRSVRSSDGPSAAPVGRLALFCGGLAAMLAALVSPVDRLGEQLAFMHMVQHLLLADLAAILLILGLTRPLLRPVTRRVAALERAAGPLAHPAFALLAYVGLLWLWHVPALYDAALEHPGLHALEHVCFGLAGGLFWWHLLSPIRARRRLGGLGPIAYITSAKLTAGMLGIALAFAPDVLYAYDGTGPHWGIGPHTDQSIAGVVMALEQSLVMGIALVWLFISMLAESEREQRRAERYGTAEW